MEKSKHQLKKPVYLLLDSAERGIHDGAKCNYTYSDGSVLRVDVCGRRTAKDSLGRVIGEYAVLVSV